MSPTDNRDAAPDETAATEPERDFKPSVRFRVLFAAAMVLIAVGYTWVWQVKTERVVAEPAPVLALGGGTSYISGGAGDADSLVEALAEQLAQVEGLRMVRSGMRNPVEDGAQQVLFADLRQGGRGNVLEVRRVDARSSDVLYVYRVEGATVEEAVYRMSVQVAMSFGLPRPAPPPGIDLRTR